MEWKKVQICRDFAGLRLALNQMYDESMEKLLKYCIGIHDGHCSCLQKFHPSY